MADEKLNTDPGEEKLPEAPAPVTADGPQAPAPEQTAAPTPQQEGPAQPEPGDVVVSFDKINELMNEKRQTARAEVEKEALELLERVGLADRKDDYPRQLSGGQKQRVAIVRALCMHPEILLLDEITAALDPEMVREVLDVVLSLAKAGSTMVIVTHEMNFARAIADRILFIENGTVVEQSDDPKAFFTSPETDRAKAFLKSFDYE